ncbi:sugar transferase [Shimia abyssi]|uniref:Lipopolysaccharide/colanic/teichoic acid biosynthesis glycosyltransferase n=1 Tax=Shimia abyssi TaxID=1662395 RepID=A0A2P8FJV5_9RHOB|nr:sugar transferase [Shimia abyssi]PSL21978.1 lipopolysaccharide/colanic/teichoic acid biosynthesis glycosyltransferase [Shimia abyssi]
MTMTTVNQACTKPKMVHWKSKRVMDIALCMIALPVLAPVLSLIALAVKTSSRGPAFFVQTRVGLDGRTFEMLKFRSMYVDAEQRRSEVAKQSDREGICLKLKRDPRVTPIGRVLRRWSLDELPQVLNVIKGDMSLVGPRPALTCEVAQYPEIAHKRHNVLPGITGLWQVSGRAEIGFDGMIALDLDYVRQVSVATDIHILLRTVSAVIGGRGAY